MHSDRNDYYGSESVSVNLTTLDSNFRPDKTPPAAYGPNRDWSIGLIPKLVMASGKLVKILLKTKVSRYLEWRSVDGSYVYQYQEGGMFSSETHIHQVPASASTALNSPLMGLLEKNRFKNFVQFVVNWDEANPATLNGFDPNRHAMIRVYQKLGLAEATIDFIGHAVALHTSDAYLRQPCGLTSNKCKLYVDSFRQYGSFLFVYPIYGLAGHVGFVHCHA